MQLKLAIECNRTKIQSKTSHDHNSHARAKSNLGREMGLSWNLIVFHSKPINYNQLLMINPFRVFWEKRMARFKDWKFDHEMTLITLRLSLKDKGYLSMLDHNTLL